MIAQVQVSEVEALPEVRRVRGTIRRIDPWSVLKFSIIFALSAMLVMLFAAVILFAAASGAGVVERLESFIKGVGWPEFQFQKGSAFRILLLFGVVGTIAWSAVNVFLAFLYNLTSDVVGGIEVTISERER
jgi:hypothetical protein